MNSVSILKGDISRISIDLPYSFSSGLPASIQARALVFSDNPNVLVPNFSFTLGVTEVAQIIGKPLDRKNVVDVFNHALNIKGSEYLNEINSLILSMNQRMRTFVTPEDMDTFSGSDVYIPMVAKLDTDANFSFSKSVDVRLNLRNFKLDYSPEDKNIVHRLNAFYQMNLFGAKYNFMPYDHWFQLSNIDRFHCGSK